MSIPDTFEQSISVGPARAVRPFIREPFCSFSHWVGVGLSIVGLVVLLIAANGKPWYVVSFTIYGASLIFLYTTSALYHSLYIAPHLFQRFDHTAIYLLIAGTYVPVCLIPLRGGWGWSLFGVEYGMAIIGILAAFVWRSEPEWFRVALYILMGWLALIAIGSLQHSIAPAGLFWLVTGGVVYTIGAVIFALDRPHLWPGRFSAHDLWHLFVMGGSACHYIFVLQYIAFAR